MMNSAVPPTTHLPPEVWQLIFEFLDNNSLLRVRRTCHQWRQLVDGTESLRKHFCVRIVGALDRNYRPPCLFPASGYASLDMVKLIDVDGSWWNGFGARLTQLHFWGCEIALPGLVALLSGTPNLTELVFFACRYKSVVAPGDLAWRLEKMQDLSCDNVLDFYGSIFPNLEILRLSHYREYDETMLCRLLWSVQATLKHLGCEFIPFLVDRIAEMSRLELNSLDHRGKEATALELCLMQPTIEDLKLDSSSDELLCQIGQNLPNLKQICATLKQQKSTFVPSFLTYMPQLTSLSLNASRKQPFNFAECTSPRLEAIHLESLHIVGSSWSRFLANCPILKAVRLDCCTLTNWLEAFAPQPQSQYFLRLSSVRVLRKVTSIPDQRTFNLKELTLTDCKIPSELLCQLLQRCPQLNTLTLNTMDIYDNPVLPSLRQLPQLKRLYIEKCALVEAAVAILMDLRRRQLNVLNIRSYPINGGALERLNRVFPGSFKELSD